MTNLKKLTKYFFILFVLSATNTIAQPSDDPADMNPNPFACNPTNNLCNYIKNNSFLKTCPNPADPYNTNENHPFWNCIAFWTYSHGTAQINKFLPQYASGVNHASMRANRTLLNGNTVSQGEGIAIGIKKLTANSVFKLSFKKRYQSPAAAYSPNLDNYYFVLLTCATFNSLRIYEENYTIPNIPTSGAQVIYVESNTTNTSWQTVEQYFTPNATYDVLWIFPKHNTGQNIEAWLEITQPEIIKTGSCETTAPPCSLSISPKGPIDYYYVGGEIPPIGVKLNSNLSSGNQWYKDGAIIPNATQQILTVIDPGNYSVKNGTCISNIVTVQTTPYSPPPGSSIGNFFLPVQSSAYYCFNSTESIKQFNLGPSATYTWNTNPNSMAFHYIDIIPSSYNIHSPNASVTIANLAPSGIVSAGENIAQGVADLNGQQKVLDYHFGLSPGPLSTMELCRNTTYNFFSDYYYNPFRLPGTTGFDSEFYDFGPNGTIVSPAIYSGQHSVTIPGNNPLSGPLQVVFTDNAYFSRYFYYSWGGCFKADIPVQIVCGRSSNEIALYPNPASDRININSEEIINSIEISGIMDPARKVQKFVNNKSAVINITGLAPGVYNCMIITNKGRYPKKLIIKR